MACPTSLFNFFVFFLCSHSLWSSISHKWIFTKRHPQINTRSVLATSPAMKTFCASESRHLREQTPIKDSKTGGGFEPTRVSIGHDEYPEDKSCRAIPNRGDRIRTCDLLVPNQALCQAELRPVANKRLYSKTSNWQEFALRTRVEFQLGWRRCPGSGSLG